MSTRFLVKQARISLLFLILTSLFFGAAYPGAVTLILQLCCSYQANGSIIADKKQMIGSELLGQHFTAPQYFWGRPSATHPVPYDPTSSNASNLGANNPLLILSVKARTQSLISTNQDSSLLIPVDLVTTSASGLDPHISIASAYFQLSRVANARKMDPHKLKNLIDRSITPRAWGFLGEPCINVLMLNIALDHETTSPPNA